VYGVTIAKSGALSLLMWKMAAAGQGMSSCVARLNRVGLGIKFIFYFLLVVQVMNGLQLLQTVDAKCGKRQVNIGNVNRITGFALPELEYMLIGGVKHLVAVIQRRKFLFIAIDRVDDAFWGVFPGDAQV